MAGPTHLIARRSGRWVYILGILGFLAYAAWITGPYLLSTVVRDATVTTRLNWLTAPIEGTITWQSLGVERKLEKKRARLELREAQAKVREMQVDAEESQGDFERRSEATIRVSSGSIVWSEPVAKGRHDGVAQILLDFLQEYDSFDECPVGRAAYVDFPDVGLIDVIRARLRL